jgi:hypothetical protein
MRTWHFILAGALLLLFAALALRWPRLDRESVSVTRSEVRGHEMLVEYRRATPFEVALAHSIGTPLKPPDGPGVTFGEPPLRSEKTAAVASSYDWLRGEYYVRLTFRRGPMLTVGANGNHFEVAAWSTPDARRVEWRPPGQRVNYGDSVGHAVLHFAQSQEQEECLSLYAGTDAAGAAR